MIRAYARRRSAGASIRSPPAIDASSWPSWTENRRASSGLSLYPPDGALINGGGVRPKFRGRGIYRAMVAARLEMAREAGVAGLSVWGAPMSAPILARLGFEKVGWRRFYR